MKKQFIFIITLPLFFVSCGRNYWSENEKINFVKSCTEAYKRTSNSNISYSACFCDKALQLAMAKYSNGEEADNKATAAEMQILSAAAQLIADKDCLQFK